MDTPPIETTARGQASSLSSIRLPALGPNSSHLHIPLVLDIRQPSLRLLTQPATTDEPPMDDKETVNYDAPQGQEECDSPAAPLSLGAAVGDDAEPTRPEEQQPDDAQSDTVAPVADKPIPVAPRIFLPPHLADQLLDAGMVTQGELGTVNHIAARRQKSIGHAIRRRVSSVLMMAGISILENKTEQEEQDRVQGLWEIFDVDGDGIIDFGEFCKYTCDLIELQKKKQQPHNVHHQQQPHQQPHQQQQQPKAMTSIEAKFVRIVILEIMQLGTLQKAIESVFSMIDLNKSGKISKIEFIDGIRALGIMEFNYEVHGLKKRFSDTSLFVFNVGNPFRYYVVWLVEWKWFDRFILFCIIANSVMLAFRDFQDPGAIPDANGELHLSMQNQILEQAEVVFSWIFVVESVLKIIAMGFLFGRGAYLRSYWNMLDFFVVVVGLIGDLPGVPKVSSLRTARVLRPLRTLSNLRRMRMLVYSLFSAIPALFNVIVILAFVFTVFGILGVLFWNGVLYNRCRTTPAPVNGVWALAGEGRLCGGAYECPTGQYCGSIYEPPDGSFIDLDQISSADKWDYAVTGFDHIGAAVLTLFQCITLEGWTAVMYNMQDAHSYVFATGYFVIFTIIGAFFLLQFIFAVIWERFNAANDGTAGEWELILEERRASAAAIGMGQDGSQKKDPEIEKRKEQFRRKSSVSQRMRISFHSGVVAVKRNNQTDRIRRFCRKLVGNNAFGNVIVFCILLNTLFLAMDEYPIHETRDAISEVVNTVLTVVFSLEMVLKLVGLGWRGYRGDRLNLFDGLIVCVSLVEIAMKIFMTDNKSSTGLSALRSFRLFRIMKLARSWKSLRELIQTIGNSLADVANFGLLLLLLMYVFSLIGMQFFANKFRFNDAGEPVEWQPHLYTNTTPPHAPWTPEAPYTIARSNFDDSIAAFTTVFQCLTEENWVSVMSNGIRSSGWTAAAYFLVVMIIGNIIILNLFLAILLGNFSVEDELEDNQNAISKGEQQIQKASQMPLKLNAVMPLATTSVQQKQKKSGPTNSMASTTTATTDASPATEKRRRRRRNHSANSVGSQAERMSVGRASEITVEPKPQSSARSLVSAAGNKRTTADSPDKKTRSNSNSNRSSSSDDDRYVSDVTVASTRGPSISGNPRQVRLQTLSTRPSTTVVPSAMAKKTIHHEIAVSDRDKSLFLFTKRALVRRMCSKVMKHGYFEALMLTIIMVSSVQLAVDNPLNDPNSDLSLAISMLDNVFTVVFFIEMVLKVVDAGFVCNGKRSYLRDPWNLLDFVILVCSSITLFSSNKTLRSLRSLRTLRAMRPLRMISRVPGMRRVVNALLSSIPCIMNVFLVCSLIFLMFGIIGVNLFKGRMFYCDMSSFPQAKLDSLEKEFGFTSLSFKKLFSEQDCATNGGVWTLRDRNYDNVFKSAMTLFEISTTEGWVDLMFQGVDATEIGFHPVENWNRWYIVFFIVFIIIGSFFTMNLFVGAVIDNFNRMRDSIGFSEAENETQREWLQIQEELRATRLIPKVVEPTQWVRRLCYRIEQHAKFEALIAASVLGNTLMLAMTHFQQSDLTSSVLSWGNVFFWFVFLIEAIVKLSSLGFRYFHDRWNLFDFAVVCGSTFSTILPFFTKGKISPVANTLRAFRMGLAIRLMKRAKSMQDIVNTILDNMPALVNVSTLMFLIMFVYAVIGVQLYAGVMLGEALNEHANFRGVGVAMVTLFRFATGEAWNDVMYDLMVQPLDDTNKSGLFPYGASCVKEYSYSDLVAARAFAKDASLTIGCSPGVNVIYLYFLSYQLLASYVLLNLFVAVILEGFEETTEKNLSTVTKADLVAVCDLWEKYDPLATGCICDHDFLKFLKQVPPPLGLPRQARRRDLEQWVKQLDLFLEANGKISFNSFILSATQSLMFKVAHERGEIILPAKSVDSFFAKSQRVVRKAAAATAGKSRRSVGSLSSVVPSLMVIISVKKIQAAMRSRMARKRFVELKKQLAGQRIMLYDQAVMSHFKGQPMDDDDEGEEQKGHAATTSEPRDEELRGPDAQEAAGDETEEAPLPPPAIDHGDAAEALAVAVTVETDDAAPLPRQELLPGEKDRSSEENDAAEENPMNI